MINSVSRIMASSYRNNTKPNNPSFKGWREDFAKLKAPKSFDDIAYGPGPGLFSSLLSAINPLNIFKNGGGSFSKASKGQDFMR